MNILIGIEFIVDIDHVSSEGTLQAITLTKETNIVGAIDHGSSGETLQIQRCSYPAEHPGLC